MGYKLSLKFTFILLLISNCVFSQDQKYQMQQLSGFNQDDNTKNKRLNTKESLIKTYSSKPIYENATFPLKYDIEINIDDLYNLDIKQDYFFFKALYLSIFRL